MSFKIAALICLLLIVGCMSVSEGDAGNPLVKMNAEEAGYKAEHDDDPRPFDASRNAIHDVDTALAAAKISGKKVLLVLGGNWCHDSRGLAAKFQQTEFVTLIENNYELVWVDVGHRDRNLDVARRFGVHTLLGTPTVLILSPEGALLNEDSVHDWRTADSKPYDETLDYFIGFAATDEKGESAL